MSKAVGSKRTIKVAVILVVVIVAVIASAWLWSSNYLRGGPSATTTTNDKIEIAACDADCGPCTTAHITIRNVGSGVVEITAIYIDSSELYRYSASVSPGKFSAPSNQIAPGETVTFTVTKASGSWSPTLVVWVRAVTKNGAEAGVSC
jgi:hypothetical protein